MTVSAQSGVATYCPHPAGLIAVAALVVGGPGPFSTAAIAAEPPLATPGEPLELTVSADQPVRFLVDVRQGHSYLLQIDQGGLNLIVTTAPGTPGEQSFNSPLFRDEHEWVVLDAERDQRLTVQLHSKEYTGTVARPVVRLAEHDTGDAPARWRILREIAAAAEAYLGGGTEGWQQAVDHHARAAELAESSGDTELFALSLYSRATIEYWWQFQWGEAADRAGRAAEAYATAGDTHHAANAQHLQAAALVEKALEIEKSESMGLAPEARALFDQALDLMTRALATQESLGHDYDAGKILNNLGYTYLYMGDYDAARPYLVRAAESFGQAREWEDQLFPLNNLGVINRNQGDLIQAIEWWQDAVEVVGQRQNMQWYSAAFLDNLGSAQLGLGLTEDAVQSFSRALSIHEDLEDINGQGRSLSGLGSAYLSTDQLDIAQNYLEAALVHRRNSQDGQGEMLDQSSLGNIHRRNGEFGKASMAYQAALRLATTPLDRADILLLTARNETAAGRPDPALAALDQARQIEAENPNRLVAADIHEVAGEAWLLQGNFEQAAAEFRGAASDYNDLGQEADRVQAVFGQARAAAAQGQKDRSLELARQVVDAVEKLRSQLIAPEFRTFFLASRQRYFDFLIDALMQRHADPDNTSDRYLREALAVSERSRSRALIDLINESAVNLAGSSAALEKQAGLYTRMAQQRFQLNELLENGDQPEFDTRIAAIKRTLAQIENELNLVQIDIRSSSPAWASLTHPRFLDTGEIQLQLNAGTALLQYALGEERSYAWLVTRNEIQAWTLPAREEIEDTARALYALLQQPAFSADARAGIEAGVERLSDQVLGPLESLDHQRLIVVADGVLHYLPFSILLGPADGGARQPLMASHEVVHLPSMSVLAARRDSRPGRPAPAHEIAIFADPVFSLDDRRFEEIAAAPGAQAALSRTTAPPGITQVQELPRLPASRYEARVISELVEPGNSLVALDFESSRDAVLETQLSDYRILHFATHGQIDSRYPALSALVFSQFDTGARPQDGRLRLHDIYNLELAADLVTLSACDTALGREISGEGLTGLTQGFIHAGSRTVLASLWQVPDRATAELMKLFYQNLLEKKQKPATALRQAQLELSSRAKWRSPYFWGAFVLQGEWM